MVVGGRRGLLPQLDGGYLLLLAQDERSAAAIRDRLTRHPPNPRARFVDFSLSGTGLQVTRS